MLFHDACVVALCVVVVRVSSLWSCVLLLLFGLFVVLIVVMCVA